MRMMKKIAQTFLQKHLASKKRIKYYFLIFCYQEEIVLL